MKIEKFTSFLYYVFINIRSMKFAFAFLATIAVANAARLRKSKTEASPETVNGLVDLLNQEVDLMTKNKERVEATHETTIRDSKEKVSKAETVSAVCAIILDTLT